MHACGANRTGRMTKASTSALRRQKILSCTRPKLVEMAAKAVHLVKADVAGPELEVVDVDRPVPGEGQVLVQLSMRPVNPADIFSLLGVYPGFRPAALPAVPGLEGVGKVVENGPGASKFAVGQRVVGAPWPVDHGNGTWQQFIVVPESCLFPVADAVSDEAAAQFWVNPVTVLGMLKSLDVPKGKYLLQSAAGSVLGRQVIQVAKHYGIRTINVVRRKELAEELKAEGADEVIVSGEEDIAARTKEITGGEGAYAAIECVGGELFAQMAAAVRNNGTIYIYGAMSGLTATFSIPDPLFRGVVIKGFWLMPWTASLSAEERQAVLQEVMDLMASGVITPYSGKKFPLDQVKEAVAEAQQAARGGKVLLEG